MAPKKNKKQVESPVDVSPKKPEAVYHLYVKLNDKVFELDTEDIKTSLSALRPSLLKTSLTVRVTKGNKTIDRYLYLNDGRRLFNNKLTLEAFVRGLIF